MTAPLLSLNPTYVCLTGYLIVCFEFVATIDLLLLAIFIEGFSAPLFTFGIVQSWMIYSSISLFIDRVPCFILEFFLVLISASGFIHLFYLSLGILPEKAMLLLPLHQLVKF